MDLSGKRVLITAAAQGIGQASVQAYLAAGAEVFATDINATALDSLHGAHKHLLDVTDPHAIERLAAELGPLDVLFNCAGWCTAATSSNATTPTGPSPST